VAGVEGKESDMSKLLPFAIAWAMLGCVVVVLALMRRAITAEEDDSVHLNADVNAAAGQQLETAKKLEVIDRWGKGLTIALAASGLVLAVFYGIAIWNASAKVGLA
jgi:pyruvate/2-oxoglutarate dehydrogenase complex dihydrolipoamide dehydrogenase (E3) component